MKKRKQVSLSVENIAILERIGRGSVSKGIEFMISYISEMKRMKDDEVAIAMRYYFREEV